MTWYLLIALMLFLFIFDYFENKNKSQINLMTIFLILLLSLINGLRGDMGADTGPYMVFFNTIPSLSEVVYYNKSIITTDLNLEPLYQICISVFKLFSHDYNLYLFTQALVLLTLVTIALRRFDVPINIGLIFYFFLLYLQHFGQQRMAIVFVICLFATSYLAKNSLWKFITTVFVASGFHYIAITFLPTVFIHRLFLSKRTAFAIEKNKRGLPTHVEISDCNHDHSQFVYKVKKLYADTIKQSAILKLAVVGIGVLIVTVSMNVFTFLFDWLMNSSAIVKTSVYGYKFTYYYQNMDKEPDITEGWFGLLSLLMIGLFLYFFRKHWLKEKMAMLFLNFCAGLILVVLVYKMPILTDRLFRMYGFTALVVLFAKMAEKQKKNSIITLPFILLVCVYLFLAKIASETGPYEAISF